VPMVAGMQRQEGIESLVRHALASDFAEVRAAATEKLRDCPPDAFMGALVEGLTSPPQIKSASVFPGPVYWQQTSVLVERLGDTAEYDDIVSLVGGIHTQFTASRNTGVTANTYQKSVDKRAVLAAQQRARAVALQAAKLELRNKRICELLQALTELDYGRDEQRWWNWWLKESDQQTTGGKQHVRLSSQHLGVCKSTISGSVLSCFDAATPVHTRQGLQRIIDVKPGDYVLCQNVESGEPTYRAVLTTTVRPTKKVLLLKVGEDQLECTLGHPFWSVGEGWKMAKELKVGDQLQLLGGVETVVSIDQVDKETQVYNLVVADCNNYFVGNSGILAHDNTPRRPTPALVPGLVEAAGKD